MGQKIIKIGSSFGVTLSQRLLKQVGLEIGDAIEVTFNSKKRIIEIASLQENVDVQVGDAIRIKQLLEKYHDALEVLDKEDD